MKSFRFSRSLWLLAAILILGAILRFYQFEPWLHFELDQSRDALVVQQGFQGSFLDLPLLGPKAGGTFLRLGPAYYYLQYVSGLVFGETPAGIAFFIPLLSTLAILFSYLLFRRGFSRFESLGLTLLFAVSVYVVLYGRFAWNPNLLIFFLPAGFYALLRAVDKTDPQNTRWFLATVFFLVLATQFHFLAFLAAPLIVAIFLLLKRPRYSWKIWGTGLLIGAFLYLPMILNEGEAGYTNTKQFFGAVTEKSTKEERNLLEKAIRNTSEYSQHAIVVLTGFEGSTVPAVLINQKEIGTVCRDKCDDGKLYGLLGLFFFLLSLGALVWARRRAGNTAHKDFYDLALIWFGVSYLIFLPLAYGVAPRFYLLVTPLFFILLGVLLKALFFKLEESKRKVAFGFAIFLFVFGNAFFLHTRFTELALAKTEAVENRPDRILKEQTRVTLEQQEGIAEFFKKRQAETGYPIYMHSDPQYRRALKYVMDEKGVQNDVLNLDNIYQEGEYYLVLRHRDDYEPALRKYRESYEVGEFQPFGTLTVIRLIPRPEKVTDVRQQFTAEEDNTTPAEAPRYTWREFFERQKPEPEEKDGEALESGDNGISD